MNIPVKAGFQHHKIQIKCKHNEIYLPHLLGILFGMVAYSFTLIFVSHAFSPLAVFRIAD